MTGPAASGRSSARSSVCLAIVGSGGAGVMTAGKLLLEAAAKSGWHGMMTRSFGAQIRGGESAALVRFSRQPVEIHAERFDILFAVDWNNFDRFAGEIPLSPDSLIIADPAGGEPPASITESGLTITSLPLQALIEAHEGVRANMIALGALGALIGIPLDTITQLIAERLGRKGDAAVAAGQAAVTLAAQEVATITGAPSLEPVTAAGKGRWLATGNQLAGLGALRGGVRFVAAYPITPATDILEWMAPELTKLGGTLVQAEDELASINMIIGGSFGGVPSLTATSGPGLSLMIESIGLAIAAEVPLVVIDVMRCGPSTGIATKSEQSDLNIAVYGCHGDAPHIVVAPTSIPDCLFTAQWATHLAEAMQTAVIMLSDQALGQAQMVLDRPGEIAFIAQRDTAVPVAGADPGSYKRYVATASAVSPMARPGTPGLAYTADGLEHNECGTPASDAAIHDAQLDKRQDKLTNFNYGDHWADIEGDGSLAVITWGSSTPPVREALARAAADGLAVRLIALRLISPAQPQQMKAALDGVDRVVVVEQTHSGQFHRYLRAQYDLPEVVETFHKPGPLPLQVDDIHEAIGRCAKS